MSTRILDKLKRTIAGQPVADAADLDGEIVFSVTKTTDDKLKIRRKNTAGETVEQQVGLGPGYVRDELYSGDINISDATPTVDIAVNTWTGYNELEIVIDIGTVCSAQAIYGSLNVFRVSQALLASLQAHTGDVEFLNYARRIGTATQFGINESGPAGLASDGTNLYMVGQTNRKRYTLNATTGVASNPGSLLPGTPTALAWHNSKLYVALIDKLYTLNANGEATQVGTMGMGRAISGLASLGGTLYGVSSASGGHTGLYSIDASNATATRIGSATYFGVSESSPGGLASDGTNLYMVGRTNKKLYTLDTTTGVATPLSSASNFNLGSDVTVTPTGLTVHNGAFYMLDGAADALYRAAFACSAAVIPLQVVTEFGDRVILLLARRSDNTLALAGILPGADAGSLKICGIKYSAVFTAVEEAMDS